MTANRRGSSTVDYGLGTVYAVATAVLLAVQEPFSALAARTLTALEFMALTQVGLLCSLPFLIARPESRRDFVAILLDVRLWPKLAVIFLIGVAGLALYDVGLSSTHPIVAAAVLNLSPFWAALVAFGVSRRSIGVSPTAFVLSSFVAFGGAMAIAWSQIDLDNRSLANEVLHSLVHSRWIYALPMPAFFALSGTLVFEWFSDFDEAGAIGANFVVSALVLLPVAAVRAGQPAAAPFDERSLAAIALLLIGTLAAAAAGRVSYQLALTATRNDNGYVTMFFLMIPGISALISVPLSRWIPTLNFIPGPAFVLGMACVSAPLAVLSIGSRRANRARATSSIDSSRSEPLPAPSVGEQQ